MRKETDMNSIIKYACTLLYMDLQPGSYPGTIKHPFFNSVAACLPSENDFEFLDITVKKNLCRVQKYIEEQLNNTTTYEQLLFFINKPYLPVFFKHTYALLSEEDFGKSLSEIWCLVEFTNSDPDISPQEFLSLFQRANPIFLMEPDELKVLQSLPDEITIYRGSKPNTSLTALSWTINPDVAQWFADRFEKNGTVYEAKISKKDVLAYFNGREEEEIIANFNKIYDIREL